MPWGGTPSAQPVSLPGTLQGQQASTPDAAQQQLQQAILAAAVQHASEAQAQASQAGQAYGQAAAAPAPDISPAALFGSTLLGNIASVLGKSPDYSNQVQEQITAERKNLLEARSTNLQSLRDKFNESAQAARQLGNTQFETEQLLKVKKLDSEIEKNQESRKQEFQSEQNRLNRKTQLDEARIRADRPLTGGGQQFDPKTVAGGIRDGLLPPDFVGFGRGGAGAVKSELVKMDYNVAKAQQEWFAVKTYQRTRNARQPLQIQQSAIAVKDGLDYMETLIDNLYKVVPSSKIAILNQAAVSSAKDWAIYGPEAMQAAQQLTTAIKDVGPELANVLQAGGTPTDQARKQAGETMNEKWNPARLRASLKTVKKLLQYRINAQISVGPQGVPEGQNQYSLPTGASPVGPEAPAPTGKEVNWTFDASGKLVQQ